MYASRYSALNNNVTLKCGLGVVQGHWKWCYSIDRLRWSAIVSTHSSILYRFRDRVILVEKSRISYLLLGGTSRNIAINFGTEKKLEWCGEVKTFEDNFSRFDTIPIDVC